MPKRKNSLCEDETFHPQICLVAIEPVSNFLILEAYAEKNDAATWNNEIDSALHPFLVDVIQCVTDEATALLSHAQSHLGVHQLLIRCLPRAVRGQQSYQPVSQSPE